MELPVRVAAATLFALASGCLDLRDFRGSWSGPRVGDDPLLRQGFDEDASADLEVETSSLDRLRARLSTSGGELDDASIEPLAAAEADVLGDIQLSGAPARVFLAFAGTTDGAGDALVITALYPDPRIEVRVLRGDPSPLYGIFVLSRD
jgi:hypothetical protein